jgi:hypothetical protein
MCLHLQGQKSRDYEYDKLQYGSLVIVYINKLVS